MVSVKAISVSDEAAKSRTLLANSDYAFRADAGRQSRRRTQSVADTNKSDTCREGFALTLHSGVTKRFCEHFWRTSVPAETVAPETVSDHYEFLRALHQRLRPAAYLETGVESGATLVLAERCAIGIDPAPRLTREIQPSMQVFPLTSDDFFAQHNVFSITGRKPIDLAFIDGLHLFEASLRDFINVEKYSHPGTVVCIHDVVPQTVRQATREPQSDGWTGDVFGMILALREHRPELFMMTLSIPGTGMLVVSNLDPYNQTLKENFDGIVAQHLAIDYAKVHDKQGEILGVAPYSSSMIEFLGANMDASRARSRMREAARIIRADKRLRLGSII